MFAIYQALAWGFVLPVLALICLALDVMTGTTPFHRNERHDQ